jgi:hypothetical protein
MILPIHKISTSLLRFSLNLVSDFHFDSIKRNDFFADTCDILFPMQDNLLVPWDVAN